MHGQDIDVDHVPADDLDAPLPPSYVDPATGEQYLLLLVNLQNPHPITGAPGEKWRNTIICTPS